MNLKDRILEAETAAATEESPLAALFRNAKPLGMEPDPSSPAAPQSPRLLELPADALDEMEQPFRLYNDAKMEKMRQSISAHGIIQRIVVRPYPEGSGHYQIVSGRNRRRAAVLAGYTMVPCEVRVLDDDEARLQMVATNLEQREELLPSEKAWAYRIQLETLAHQGKMTSTQFVSKRSNEEIGAENDESREKVRRYIRLTYLSPELLEAVDNGTLGFGAGASLSYLPPESQTAVHQYFFVDHKQKISGDLADKLRAAGEGTTLSAELIRDILFPAVKKGKPLRKVSIPMKPLRRYFPAEATSQEIEQQIIQIVIEHFRKDGNA
ncbi:MAG: ParB/RepB/Spo0J family partition protein [Pseudoflavonifractor sp.]|nr:ParB/RepB/Spo0J family partition protein [Pseudoflavonifractor sp.]